MWNFFGSGQGKEEDDGAGIVIKCALTEQLDVDGKNLLNAHHTV